VEGLFREWIIKWLLWEKVTGITGITTQKCQRDTFCAKSAYCASAVVNKRGVQIEHDCHKICRMLVAYEVRQVLYWMVVCCDGDIETSRGVAVNLPVCTVTASLPFSLRRFSDPTENTLTVYHAPDLSCSICTLVFSVSLTLGTWVSVELESWMRYRWAPSK